MNRVQISKTAAELFESQRSILIGLIYRITGVKAEAEDIAQEVFLRWQETDPKKIISPRAWLTTVATRLSLDYLKTARVQRQDYIGPWLPEPFVDDRDLPEKKHEIDESITMALLLVLEQLSPAERAAYILHDLFGYEFKEIADILNKNTASCRKLASRARNKMRKENPQTTLDAQEHRAVIHAFFEAIKKGDTEKLISTLSESVVFHSDGGGKATAARKILSGSELVCKFLVKAVFPKLNSKDVPATIKPIWFNGSPGYVIWQNTKPITAFNFVVCQSQIRQIHAIRNPDKLRDFEHLTPSCLKN